MLALALVAGACAPERGRPAASTRPAPVLLVPGFLVPPGMLAPLRDRLRRGGRQATIVVLPQRGTAGVVESARAVAHAVKELEARRVDLVGFSSGGVVVRAFLTLLGGLARARTVVLLGAPNHGARLAEVAAALDPSLCTGACRQLRPGSAFLDRLNGRDETPGDARYVSIWTARDATVTPPVSARLRGATNVRVQDLCPGARVGHADLVSDRRAVGMVVLALRGALARATGCARARAAGGP